MIAVQLMCARIGVVAGQGLAGVLRDRYPRWVLWLACALLLVANVVNIGADLGAMAAVVEMLTGAPRRALVPLFAGLVLALLVFERYAVIARVFKWLTLVLLAYVVTAFLARPDWHAVLRATFLPDLHLDRSAAITLVAVLGTTISPYLFFWQAAEEVEEEIELGRATVEARRGATRKELRDMTTDVVVGMAISVLIFYFIVLTSAATLHRAGLTEVRTAEEAAAALRPLAGDAASFLFAIGIIGTGMLGVSVLAGSAALAIAEAARWPAGMSARLTDAKAFYGVMAASVVASIAMIGLNLGAIQMLYWAAVVNGVLAPPLIVIVLVICNDRRVMGEHRNGWVLNALGAAAALVMGGAALALLPVF